METIKSIFELKIIYYLGDLKYPIALKEERVGLFTSVEKAEEKLKALPKDKSRYSDYYEEDKDDPKRSAHIHHFSLQEITLDCDFRYTTFRIYDEKGEFYNGLLVDPETPFYGRKAGDYKFELGDFVETLIYDKIVVGLICGIPFNKDFPDKWKKSTKLTYKNDFNKALTDEEIDRLYDKTYPIYGEDVYFIIYGYDDFSHSHSAEYSLFPLKKQINPRLKKRLMERLEKIKNEYD